MAGMREIRHRMGNLTDAETVELASEAMENLSEEHRLIVFNASFSENEKGEIYETLKERFGEEG